MTVATLSEPQGSADHTTAAMAAPLIPERPVGSWVRLLTATLARMMLILALSLAAWASLPVVLGWEPTTVMSGSMEPRISTGDVVVARPVDASEYKPGRVVLVDDPDDAEKLRLHRVVSENVDGDLVLRGDANPTDDPSAVSKGAVHGIGFLRVPYIGLPIFWITTGQWIKFALLIGAAILLCWLSTIDKHLHRSRHRGDPPASKSSWANSSKAAAGSTLEKLGLVEQDRGIHSVDSRRPSGRRSIRLGTVVVVSALALGTVPVASQAAFSAATSNASDSFASATYLGCSAAVLASKPSIFYRFNADSGTRVVDSVAPTTGDGSFVGNRAASTDGSGACSPDGGQSAVFDGTTSYISTPTQNMTAPQVFSYELWFKTTSKTGGKLMSFATTPLVGQAPVDDNRVLYMFDTGNLRFGLTTTIAYQTTNSTYNDGKWHHVAVVLSATTGMRLYVDGAETNASPQIRSAPVTLGSWVIGTGASGTWTNARTSTYFSGELDDVAIYNTTALTSAEVAAHYAAGRAPVKQP